MKFVIGGTLTILSWDNPVTAFFRKSKKLRHSLGRPSRSDFVQFQVGDLIQVMVNKVEGTEPDEIHVEVDAKSPTANINKDNLRKCHRQGKYTGVITEVYKGTYFIRLDIGINAVAHSCNMSALPGKGDKIGIVVTRINDNYEVAEGIITRLIKRWK